MGLMATLAKGLAEKKAKSFVPPTPGAAPLKKKVPMNSGSEVEHPDIEDKFPENAIDQVATFPNMPASKAWKGLIKGAFRDNKYANSQGMQ